MKQKIPLLALLFLCLCSATANAQAPYKSFIYLQIPDTTIITGMDTTGGQRKPVFSVAGINNILANKKIVQFRPVFRTSRFKWLRQMYMMALDSTGVGAQLHAAYRILSCLQRTEKCNAPGLLPQRL